MNLGPFVVQPLRALLRRPGFSAVVILTLMLGIGVTTAVFSIFNGVLLTPLQYPEPEQLVAVYDTQPACATCPASFPKYRDWAERNQVFQAIAGATRSSFVLTGAGDPSRFLAFSTTASFLDVFRVKPILGRWYTEQEDQAGGPKVIVLSHATWTRHFQASPAAVGQKLILDGEPYEIIGVMPPRAADSRIEAFVPLQRKLDPATRGNHFLPVFARLKPGVTVETAQRDMRALGETLAKEFGHNHGVDVKSYTETMVGQMRAPLNVLLGAVLLLLLIGAANVANLMLAAGLARRRELAIRMSLGADLRGLAAMLVAEGLWLAAVGGLLGIVLSRWIVMAFIALAGNQLPRASEIQLDGRVLAFSALLSLAVGLLCSLFPVLLLRKPQLAASVREGDVRGGSQSGNRTRRALVVAEIALAFGLLVCSALLIKNLILLQNRDAGVRTERIVAFQIPLSGQRYAKEGEVKTFYRALYDRLRRVDGVLSAGFTSHLPMVDFGWNGEFQIEGETPWPPNQAPLVEYRWLHGDFLKTMGVPLLQGRLLGEQDGEGTRTVLINKAMAEKFWPGKDAIGRRFGQGSDRSKWFEVVGVIGNVRSYGLARSYPFEFYRTIDQSAFNRMTAVIATRSEDPLSIVPVARQIVQSLDPALPLTEVRTMEKAVAESVGRPRLMSALTGLFGGLAGLLAMVGVYSVMAYNVNRQRREFGIRLALGAAPGSVRSMVLGRGLVLALIGIAIGAAGAAAFTRVLEAVLNDVKPGDISVFALTAAAVAGVALLASYLPARAAARVNPVDVLRAE
ncbi:MAG: ABC transporter permease [Bryobacteraceae bacterium]|nr:ABC transporter permease [Bryobacteraceae bacterium]